MGASGLQILFLAVFASGIAIELALIALNRREVLSHPGLPPLFAPGGAAAAHFDADAYASSRAYTLDRLSFDAFSVLYSASITLALLFSGILPWAEGLLAGAFGDGPHRGAILLAGIVLVQSLLAIPLSAYATFRIEGKYGFNTMTWKLFRRDLMRGFLISAALGLPLLYALLALIRFLGGAWWLWAFGLLAAFQFGMMVLYPTLIAPLFNRFRPMEEGETKRALLELADRLRFPASGIQVMDGSRRSLHSNAYFTGFGRFRRIVIYDTLLRQLERSELIGVLAHEIGHYKLGHILKSMVVQTAILGATLWLGSLALRWPPLYQAFGFAAAPDPARAFAGSPAAGLYLYLTLISSLSAPLSPLRNLLSRRHEYQADAFAVEATGNAGAMGSALAKLARKNLSNLTPHPLYSSFHYSHPTLAERLRALQISEENPARPHFP